MCGGTWPPGRCEPATRSDEQFSLDGADDLIDALLTTENSLTFRFCPILSSTSVYLPSVDSTVISWLSLDELARYLKKPKSTLYKLVNRGQLPGHKLGRAWCFDRDEVDRSIKRRGLRSNSLGAKK